MLKRSIHIAAVLLSTFLIMLSALPVHAEITAIASAINMAGRQRMLTQSMVKDYCLVGQDIDKEKAQGRLLQSVSLFEMQLKELKSFAPNDEVRHGLAKVETLWQPFKVIVTAPPSRDKVASLLMADDELLPAAHRVVLLLQDISGKSQDRLVNISGRQRMLSQRIAKLYMLQTWGFENSQIGSDMDQAKNEFKGALTELENATENNPAVRYALTEARRQWNLYEHGLNRQGSQRVPLVVAMTSDKLLVTLNDITAMYELIASEAAFNRKP